MTYAELLQKEKQYVLQTYTRYPVALKKGKGLYVWDVHNKKYLDFLSGIAVNNLGHYNKIIYHVLKKAAQELIHTSNYFYQQPQIELAEKLSRLTNKGKVFFSNSGAEANECALKLARIYGNQFFPKKQVVVTLKESFHGRTLATIFATGQVKYQKGFEPPAGQYRYLTPNKIDELNPMLDQNVSAIFIELIQGEGGINQLDYEFVQALNKVCQEKKILLMVDEVQTGFGRTGKLFAFEHYGIIPDVITLAKPIAAGLPMGLTLIKNEYADLLQPGMHASTFGGGYLVCSVANKVLDIINQPFFLNHINEVGDYFKGKLMDLKVKYNFIEKVKGLGLMLGLGLIFPGKEVVVKALQEGLIMNCVHENVLRFVPPLIVEKKHVDQVFGILDKIFMGMK